jgi:hypothetical protein
VVALLLGLSPNPAKWSPGKGVVFTFDFGPVHAVTFAHAGVSSCRELKREQSSMDTTSTHQAS